MNFVDPLKALERDLLARHNRETNKAKKAVLLDVWRKVRKLVNDATDPAQYNVVEDYVRVMLVAATGPKMNTSPSEEEIETLCSAIRARVARHLVLHGDDKKQLVINLFTDALALAKGEVEP